MTLIVVFFLMKACISYDKRDFYSLKIDIILIVIFLFIALMSGEFEI